LSRLLAAGLAALGHDFFFFPSLCSRSVLSSPCRFADSWRFSVAALPSTDALLPAPAVAALLNASGSEDSH
jgi:hypothetical protein